MEEWLIDTNWLRNDVRELCMGAYFGGGFGEALVDCFDANWATPNQLAEMGFGRL